MTFDKRMTEEDGDLAKGSKRYRLSQLYKLQDCTWTVVNATLTCKLELDEDEYSNQQFRIRLLSQRFYQFTHLL